MLTKMQLKMLRDLEDKPDLLMKVYKSAILMGDDDTADHIADHMTHLFTDAQRAEFLDWLDTMERLHGGSGTVHEQSSRWQR